MNSRDLFSALITRDEGLRQGLTRRQFIVLQAKAALGFSINASGILVPVKAFADTIPDIAIARGKPGPAVRAAIDLLGGMGSFVRAGDKVVIKPNMSFARGPDSATNTDPEVVRELFAMCKEAGASRVRVLDHPLRPNELCIEGVRDACRVFGDNNVQALEDSYFYQRTQLRDAVKFSETDIMKDVLDADVLIAAPVAKSHSSTGVSLSMKGMMGLVLNRSVMHWRYDLSTAIVDLCTYLKPKLVVIDATRVLSTNGPGGPGIVLKEDTIIASKDMVAADAAAVQLFEWYGKKMQPSQVKHIKIAHERGLGRMDINNLMMKKVQV